MYCSLPGSSVHGILQARILEWVSISSSRRSPPSRDETLVSCIAGRFFTLWTTRAQQKDKSVKAGVKDLNISPKKIYKWSAGTWAQMMLMSLAIRETPNQTQNEMQLTPTRLATTIITTTRKKPQTSAGEHVEKLPTLPQCWLEWKMAYPMEKNKAVPQ